MVGVCCASCERQKEWYRFIPGVTFRMRLAAEHNCAQAVQIVATRSHITQQGQTGLTPVKQVITLPSHGFLPNLRAVNGWPNEQIDEMFLPLVHQPSHGPVSHIIQAARDSRKTLICKIFHRGREIQLAVEPWFDRMLVGVRSQKDLITGSR
jgi:hypothetical protein